MPINPDTWFLLLAFLDIIQIFFLLIVILILLYNIIKRAERFKPIEKNNKKDIGFGR
jgi:hypothetical protein